MLKFPAFTFLNVIITSLIVFVTGCSTPKNTNYFQGIPYNSEVETLITKDFEHKVKPDDILQITIVSPSEEVKSYNTSPEGYIVNKNGRIQLYKIGDINVSGMTLSQIRDRIHKLLVPDYFKQASVIAKFKNHKVVFLGEVSSPGIIPMETEHLSILEAISMKGDLKPTARKDNVLVIRNTEKGKMFYRVNLLDGSVFNSNYYYLQADDIVYVEADTEGKNKLSTQQFFTYLVSGASFLFLIFDRINR